MCACDKHIVNLRRRHRHLLILVDIRPLLHPAVHQKMLLANRDIVAASPSLHGLP